MSNEEMKIVLMPESDSEDETPQPEVNLIEEKIEVIAPVLAKKEELIPEIEDKSDLTKYTKKGTLRKRQGPRTDAQKKQMEEARIKALKKRMDDKNRLKELETKDADKTAIISQIAEILPQTQEIDTQALVESITQKLMNKINERSGYSSSEELFQTPSQSKIMPTEVPLTAGQIRKQMRDALKSEVKNRYDF